jgi:hypothetical protein
MSTSQRTFNQVKSILTKLDRSIDEARAQRLGSATENPQGSPPSPGGSGFGRAQPLRATRLRNDADGRWNT